MSYEDAIYPLWVRAYQPETFSHKRRSPKPFLIVDGGGCPYDAAYLIAVARAHFLGRLWLKIAVVHLRDHQSSSPEFVRKLLPLCFWFYTGSAPRGSTGLSLSAGLDAGLSLGARLSLSTGLRVGLSPRCHRAQQQHRLIVGKAKKFVCRPVDVVAITRTLSFIVASHVSYD